MCCLSALVYAADTEADTENVTSEVVEEIIKEAVEHISEEAIEQEELKAGRPDKGGRPTKVHFMIFVIDIDEIDDAKQSFTGNIYIRLRWQDERLANPEGTARQLNLREIWNPRVIFANQHGAMLKSLPEVVQVSPDGMVIYHQRYTGTISQPLRLSDFPMDEHMFTIQLVAAGYQADQLQFIPDTLLETVVGGAIADTLSLPDWEILEYEALTLAYRPIEIINAAGFAFRFKAKRYFVYYMWQIILPLAVVVLMACAAFWIKRTSATARIAVGTSSILTIIAHRLVLASLLPRLPYMTRMDYFTVGSTIIVFLSLSFVIMTAYLTERGRDDLSHRIDLGARLLFPLTFFLLLGWFLMGY